ncbi:LLM class flavin-dependent oxidoreductase [Paraburkholderia tropica]|uniref:LLM class flavin-dependent oxidoreductase n=1 Tax=Paraburkholderia tropica TaxID=92647 RepID=UPI0007EDB4BB|nr:LLM class flavin-dependent oxidoreductase [Paraburkholderia tropica]MBB2981958.1 alkanesulfonate monooxygenase SsuD/methylene tetrahydromethanopterin reductase-like flavin-dependent oxidoreductase (luciferase family) [Paraburkholderia tropica]OBR51144.1 monooxygenase [Paraburkholderia tropica]
MTSSTSTTPVTPSAARPFKLGFLTHVHDTGDAARVYAELEALFIAAEELGFDGGFVAQHHFRAEHGRLPSPLVLLAAIAQRTRRIELGTGIVTLPLEDPIRLAEDAAVLDALAGGRVQLGLGSGGANVDAFAAFGVAPDTRQSGFASALTRLEHAFEGRPLAPAQAADNASNTDSAAAATLRLQPAAPGLRERLWHSHSSADGARLAAQHGNGLLLGTAVHDPRTVQLPLARAYLDAWREHASPGTPRLGIVRAVFPAADRRTARDALAPDVVRHGPWLATVGHPGVSDPEQILRLLNVHYGPPEEIVDSLLADPALFPFASYFLPVVQSESSTLDEAIERLRILAEIIAPALGWSPASERA